MHPLRCLSEERLAMEVSPAPHYLLVDDHSLIREGMMQAIRSLAPTARFSQANSLQSTLAKLEDTAATDPTRAFDSPNRSSARLRAT